MENTKQTELSVEEIADAGIGQDKPQIAAKRVVVKSWKIEPVIKEGKPIGNKLVLNCVHPDIADKEISISGIKFANGDKLKETGLWVQLDNDKKIGHNSAIGHLLRFMQKEKIKHLIGEQIDTVANEGGYLLVKAY